MKCEICGNKIGEMFLGKLRGGYVKDDAGKKHAVCSDCQKKHQEKRDLISNLK